MLARQIERLDAVARPDRRIAVGFQQIVEELHVELVVFHNQDGFRHPHSLRRSPARCCGRPESRCNRYGRHREASPDVLRKGKWKLWRSPQGRLRKAPKCWRFRRLPSSPKIRIEWAAF